MIPSPMNIIEAMQWRYAVKKFDSTRKISHELISELAEMLRLSPSAFGVQPWKFICIGNQEIKDKMVPFCNNQGQARDASHVFVFCTKNSFSQKDIEKYIQSFAQLQGKNPEDLHREWESIGKIGRLTQHFSQKDAANIDVSLAFGILILSCAMFRIDACPMIGFDHESIDELLGLKNSDFKSLVLLPIGYRSENDKYANISKMRYEQSDIFEYRE